MFVYKYMYPQMCFGNMLSHACTLLSHTHVHVHVLTLRGLHVVTVSCMCCTCIWSLVFEALVSVAIINMNVLSGAHWFLPVVATGFMCTLLSPSGRSVSTLTSCLMG